MEERPVYSYIPKNLSLTGGAIGGSVDLRRVLEAIIGAFIAVFIYKGLSQFIHSEMLVYVCGFLGVALFFAGLLGGNGEPISIFIFNFINYENRRYFVTLRPPMPDFKAEKKEARKSNFEDRLLSLRRKGRGRR